MRVDSVETECNVIAAALAAPECLWQALEICKPEQFRDRRNRLIFRAMTTLARNGEPYDYVAVKKSLEESGDIKGVTYTHLGDLLDGFVPDVANIPWYASKIAEEHARGIAMQQANALKSNLEAGKAMKEVLDQHMVEMMRLHGDVFTGEGAVHISKPVESVLRRLEALKSGDTTQLGLRTKVKGFDDKFGYLAPKNVYVVCGGVSAGKSAMVDQIADTVAEQGSNVMIFALEMSVEQRAERFLSRRGRVPMDTFSQGEYLSRDIYDRLTNTAEKLKSPPIFIDDSRGITTMDIQARARKFKESHGLGLLVIDYLQLIRPLRRTSREQEVAEISGEINNMAADLNIPILLVSQLSRQHQVDGRRPELRDLRESGRIEQDAFGVVAVYRPDLTERATELIVLKNRQGPLGIRRMYFYGEQVRFEEMEVRYEEGYAERF